MLRGKLDDNQFGLYGNKIFNCSFDNITLHWNFIYGVEERCEKVGGGGCKCETNLFDWQKAVFGRSLVPFDQQTVKNVFKLLEIVHGVPMQRVKCSLSNVTTQEIWFDGRLERENENESEFASVTSYRSLYHNRNISICCCILLCSVSLCVSHSWAAERKN